MNVECDFVHPGSEQLEAYTLLVVPALYAAPDQLLQRLNAFVHSGGPIVYTFKSGFSDEHVKVRTVHQPGIISESLGPQVSLPLPHCSVYCSGGAPIRKVWSQRKQRTLTNGCPESTTGGMSKCPCWPHRGHTATSWGGVHKLSTTPEVIGSICLPHCFMAEHCGTRREGARAGHPLIQPARTGQCGKQSKRPARSCCCIGRAHTR